MQVSLMVRKIITDTIINLVAVNRMQYTVLVSLSVGITVLALIVYFTNPRFFLPYFGSVHPLIAVGIVITTGFIVFSFALSRNWFVIVRPCNSKGLLAAFFLASILALLIIVVDSLIKYPENINVPFPYSIPFYPVMGFVVEIIFHLLPLTLLLSMLSFSFKNVNTDTLIWISIVVVSIIEPVFQLRFGDYRNYPVLFPLYTGLHIFGINFFQFYLLKHYDFITMFSMRLIYYFYWHMAWGYLRLHVLF